MSAPHLAFFYGDDDFAADRAVDELQAALVAAAGGPVDRWAVRGDAAAPGQLVAEIGERLATHVLFGGGTLAVVTNPGPLIRRADHRDALLATLPLIATGNGIAFVAEAPSGSRREPPLKPIATAVTAAGGTVREFRAPREGQLAAWIEARAREREIALGPGAARELATRVGGFVREGDVERRRQGLIAVNELDKLALYRPNGTVGVDDVRALVAEVVPGSTWALLDAVGARRTRESLELLDRLLGSTHELVILSQLHRRIRELLQVADLLESGTRPGAIVTALKLNPYRAERLAEQARAWTLPELEAALTALLDVDALVRGAAGAADEGARRLAFTLWVVDRVGRTAERPVSV